MKKVHVVRLTQEERQALKQVVRRERVAGAKRRRALILLKADEGCTDQEIAEEVEVAVATVERVRKRSIQRGIGVSIERKPRDLPRRPRKVDGAAEAELVRIACSEPPAGRTRWTLSLLSDKLVELKVFDAVSKSTVQRTLKKTRSSLGR